MRAVLVQCPLWGFVPPLGLAQLSACLKAKGFPVELVDLNIELYHQRGSGHRYSWSWEQNTVWLGEDVDRFLEEHEGFVASRTAGALPAGEPALVGFSVNECSLRASLWVARRLRELRPRAFIVFGGQAFAEPDRIERALKDGSVDAVAVGDGDETIVELAGLLSEGRGPEACAGLRLWREGRVVSTGEREAVDLDKIPFLDFEALPMELYKVPDNLYHDSLMIMASRGCVRQCMFCGSRAPWEGYRYMSGRRVFDEIKHQLDLFPGFKELKFYDIVTNGHMGRVLELCDLIAADKTVRLSWEECNCIVRPDMDYEALRRMKEAGCHRITYGIESGSDRVLRLMRKGQTAAMAERVLKDTHRAGMVATANFMFGYPGETEEDFEETLEFVRRVHPYVDLFYPSRTFVTMEPLSEMSRRRAEIGIDDGNDVFWESQDGTNTYPVRLERYERFSRLLAGLGARESQGVNSSLDLHRAFALGEYYEFKGLRDKAAEEYRRYLELDPTSAVMRRKLEGCLGRAG